MRLQKMRPVACACRVGREMQPPRGLVNWRQGLPAALAALAAIQPCAACLRKSTLRL